MRTECVGPTLGANVTSTVFESKDEPTQMTKQSFTIIDFITSGNLYTLNSYAKMFTIEDSIFPNTWIQFSNPKLNNHKKKSVSDHHIC